jgi:hypothetical protein
LCQARKGNVDFAIVARCDELDGPLDRSRRRPMVPNRGLSRRIRRVNEHSNMRGAWQQIVQESEPFWPKVCLKVVNTGEVAAGLIEAGDKAILNRV